MAADRGVAQPTLALAGPKHADSERDGSLVNRRVRWSRPAQGALSGCWRQNASTAFIRLPSSVVT
jgi:hypothetical protein